MTNKIALKLSITTKAKLITKTNARMQADMLDVFGIMYLHNFNKKLNSKKELLCLKAIYFISVTFKL